MLLARNPRSLLLPVGTHCFLCTRFILDSRVISGKALEQDAVPKIQFYVLVLFSFEIPPMALNLFDSLLSQ